MVSKQLGKIGGGNDFLHSLMNMNVTVHYFTFKYLIENEIGPDPEVTEV